MQVETVHEGLVGGDTASTAGGDHENTFENKAPAGFSRAAVLAICLGTCFLASALIWPSWFIDKGPYLADEEFVVEEWESELQSMAREGLVNLLEFVKPAVQASTQVGKAGDYLVAAAPVITGAYPPAGAVAASAGGALITASRIAGVAKPFVYGSTAAKHWTDCSSLMEAVVKKVNEDAEDDGGFHTIIHSLMVMKQQLRVIERKLDTIAEDTLSIRMHPQKKYFMRADTFYRTMLMYVKTRNKLFEGEVHSWYRQLVADSGYFTKEMMRDYLKLVRNRRGPAAAAVMFQEASIARLHVLNIFLAFYELNKQDTRPLLDEFGKQMTDYNETLEELQLHHWNRLPQEYLQRYINKHDNVDQQIHISHHWDKLLKAITHVSHQCRQHKFEALTDCYYAEVPKKDIETHSRRLLEIGRDNVEPVTKLLHSDLFGPPNPVNMDNVWCERFPMPFVEPAPKDWSPRRPAHQPARTCASKASFWVHGYDCTYGREYNQEYAYQGTTKDGRPYYRGVTATSKYIYYDRHCAANTPHGRWFFSGQAIDPNLDHGFHRKGNLCWVDGSTADTDSRNVPEGKVAMAHQWCGNRAYQDKSVDIKCGPDPSAKKGPPKKKTPVGVPSSTCASLRVTQFQCKNGYGNKIDGEYVFWGTTKDGRPYYRGVTEKLRYIYYDLACAPDTPGGRWLLGAEPDPNLDHDLNRHDKGQCHNEFSILSEARTVPEGNVALTFQWCGDRGYHQEKSIHIGCGHPTSHGQKMLAGRPGKNRRLLSGEGNPSRHAKSLVANRRGKPRRLLSGSDFSCAVDSHRKARCGAEGISEDACHNLKCCYALDDAKAPVCYHKEDRDSCKPQLAADSLKRRWIVYALINIGHSPSKLRDLLNQKLKYTDRMSPYHENYKMALGHLEEYSSMAKQSKSKSWQTLGIIGLPVAMFVLATNAGAHFGL